MNKQITSWLAVGLGIIVILIAVVGGNNQPQTSFDLGASGTRFPNGISADSTSPSAGEVRGATLTTTGAGSFGGLLTLNASQLKSSTNSTSTTATAQTLVLADVNGYDNIILTPNTADLTLTFFASSTASTWLPAAGDQQDTCFYNATTTSGIDIIFAAGTGFDLETASSSPTDLTLLNGNRACFSFMRQPATATTFDISASMIEYTNGD